jgi:hypothetical protein
LTEAWLADSRDNDALAVAEAMAELQPIPPISGGAPTEPTAADWRDYGAYCAEVDRRNLDRYLDAQTGPDRTGALDGHSD